MLKLAAIAEVAHKLEDALGSLRDRKIAHSKGLADLIFKGIDAITDMIDKTAAGQGITADYSALCEALSKAAEGTAVSSGGVAATAPVQAAEGTIKEEVRQPEVKDAKYYKAPETVRISSDKLDELIKLMGEIVSNQNRLKQRLQDVKGAARLAKRNLELVMKLKSKRNGGFPDAVADSAQSLSIELQKLLSNMKDYNNIQELLTDELQTKALMMRMVPLSLVFDSLPRMVRDISQAIGKEVDIVTVGGDIELDKKMIDKIGDPLVHMIRNSIDHGIEAPGERVKLGKPARGVIRLAADYDAGGVLIQLSDDGGGIPHAKIREKALRKKMFSENELNVMTESALVDLIFQPGFSTSAIVTDVSGRGVGMDVVKRNIVVDLRGTLRIETKAGAGTTFYIRLPMTLAVMRILLIGVSGMTFGIVTHYVREIVRAQEADFKQVLDKKAIALRNELIPVAGLDSLLRVPGPRATDRRRRTADCHCPRGQ